MFHNFYRFVLFFLIASFHSSMQVCKFRYAEDFAVKESVLVNKRNNSYQLIKPKLDSIILQSYEKIFLACPGSNNKFVKSTNITFIAATCVKDQTLKIHGNDYELKDLDCDNRVTGEYKNYNAVENKPEIPTVCDDTGTLRAIGHNIANEFKPLIFVCYDDKQGITLETVHIIYGSALDYAGSYTNRPYFKVPGLPSDVSPKVYEIKHQKETFKKILQNKNLAKKYFKDNSFLAKGHLVPDADMIFVSSQLSTYFYINAVPQWQQINTANWKSVEISIRKVASKEKNKFLVFTGTYDVLTLLDINGNQAKMYLSNKKLPVPKFIWKIIYSQVTKEGIAFVIVNNPFIKKITSDLILCTDICTRYSWGTSNWRILSKGLVYCCNINDLIKKIPTVFQETVIGIQRGPNEIK